MARKNKIAQKLFEKHIKGTAEKAIVENVTVFLCRLTFVVSKDNQINPNVYLNSRVLKHVYDKKPAEEFNCLVQYLHIIIRYPDNIYKNKNPKRGDYVFTKVINGNNYFCSLETFEDGANVVTMFRLRKGNYLKSYDLLWSWRGDIPSS